MYVRSSVLLIYLHAGSGVSKPFSQNHCIKFTPYSTCTTTKVVMVHSLSSTAEESEDHGFGVSDDSGVVIES